MDSTTAASLLRGQLNLPTWVGSVSAWEEDGAEAIVVRLERRYAHKLPMLPKMFEGYPVIIQIKSTMVAH
jgi:hypothetical protein